MLELSSSKKLVSLTEEALQVSDKITLPTDLSKTKFKHIFQLLECSFYKIIFTLFLNFYS